MPSITPLLHRPSSRSTTLTTKNQELPLPMSSSRNGKIAKLPIQLREQLNVRISEGFTLKSILEWLNTDPAVLSILNTHFGGRPISQQNMSEWRLGGYEEWLANQEYFSDARAFAERRKFLDSSGISAEDLLGVITARWASIMDTMHEMDIISLNCSIGRWQKLTNSAAILRKLELQKARLDLDRETRQPKGEKKDEEASSSPHSTVPAESISPASDTANSAPITSRLRRHIVLPWRPVPPGRIDRPQGRRYDRRGRSLAGAMESACAAPKTCSSCSPELALESGICAGFQTGRPGFRNASPYLFRLFPIHPGLADFVRKNPGGIAGAH